MRCDAMTNFNFQSWRWHFCDGLMHTHHHRKVVHYRTNTIRQLFFSLPPLSLIACVSHLLVIILRSFIMRWNYTFSPIHTLLLVTYTFPGDAIIENIKVSQCYLQHTRRVYLRTKWSICLQSHKIKTGALFVSKQLDYSHFSSHESDIRWKYKRKIKLPRLPSSLSQSINDSNRRFLRFPLHSLLQISRLISCTAFCFTSLFRFHHTHSPSLSLCNQIVNSQQPSIYRKRVRYCANEWMKWISFHRKICVNIRHSSRVKCREKWTLNTGRFETFMMKWFLFIALSSSRCLLN